MTQPVVGIIMGSQTDLNVMSGAAQILEEFEIAFELTIVSAHRTPDRMFAYAREARPRGLRVIIAGAGGAAHLPGMVAALTSLPVIGVPVKSANSLDGWDSILSILQMPGGIPVATVALNQSKNAGLLAARILGAGQPEILDRMEAFLQRQREQVEASVREVADRDYREFL